MFLGQYGYVGGDLYHNRLKDGGSWYSLRFKFTQTIEVLTISF